MQGTGLVLFGFVFVVCGAFEGKSYNKLGNYAEDPSGSRGLFPEIFNLASVAEIKANATCGERGPENFCRLSPWTGRRGDQCGVCDGRSPDHAKRHLAAFALDGKGRWWQSPTLQAGSHYEWVTLTIDLKQEYQVAYVIVKSGISPRPGNWILERSLDGESYQAWQYYAVSDDECWSKFGVRPAPPYPNYQSDTEVLCTSFFSKIKPFEGGEIHTSLVRGRPGVNSTSPELANFTRARYIRLRLQKIRLSADRPHLDRSVANRFFYSIKDITIGGQCICSGHASKCRHNDLTGEAVCACEHNTCGNRCDTCCPLYNQEAFRLGTSFNGAPCQQCQCFGHATSCHYDPEVAAARLSLNTHGLFSGGGVCNNCSKHTTGVNCDQCESGWYRPLGVRPDAAEPCLPCDCHRFGSTGSCVRDDSQSHQGKPAGTCDCVVGYTGPKCDRCAPGFHNFPNCEPCPCDADGSKPSVDCGDNCICKKNVEGEHCNQCKQGYFFLDRDNPDGCTECYCSGVSQSCVEASGYRLHEVNTLSNWLVSDITVSRTVLPSIDPDTKLLVVGNYELPGVESYYWLAPEAYRGNKLTSYGATLTFRVSWVIMRGDSSGKPTSGPDVILVGSNGFRIGYGESWYHQNNMSVTIQLVETGWYQMRDDDRAGRGITRAELLNVLSDIKYLLVRAKFHSDQVEGSLVSVCFETGVEGTSGTAVGYLEECTCPAGYKGLSCESCDFGYARILPDSSAPHQQAVCSKCNCYGHAASCDSTTGQCAECEHHTIGPNCERCAHGYYGDAQQETPNDCKRCACPLEDPENNFSPSCETDGHGDDYVCTQCPQGYQGRHCEECSPGYFGNPLEKGSKCKQCDCNEGPCDPLTGQCLSCRGNTEGWRCERCKPAHYGDPKMFDCRSCDCSDIGSLRTDECDSDSGQCECKDKYTGRACDRCQAGLGNITAGCVSCNCDSVGSTSSLCDPITGQCSCHPGVGNSKCQECLPLHYGFSNNGCNQCQCSELGSLNQECDIDTGQCNCIDHVIGRACDTCLEGWWGLIAGPGIPLCRPCKCDAVGSINSSCDSATGQCICKPGVGGIACDICMELFYGFSVYGCSECEDCDKKGHICDPDTGRCVCPPFTEGDDCETCQPNTWGYQAKKGCKPCNCDTRGSTTGQCDEHIGRCDCRPGYSGEQCNTCARGYYGFPRCRPCDCDKAGTKSQHCPQGVCVCDDVGQCPCKANVMGKHCDQCKNGTFGLHPEQPDGCIHCFCFGRTTMCSEAGLTWSQLRTTRPRTLNINYDNTTSVDTNFPVNTQEVCYINLAVPGSTGMSLNGDASRLNITNNLRIIPGDAWDVEIGVSFLFDSPVYWQLPSNFLGDKVLSYGGFLRFTVETEGGTTLLPPAVLASYPLIQIQGNGRIILEHFPVLSNPSPRHEVRFHESLWRMKNNPTGKVSRDMLMIALQNVQHILIRASDSVDFTRAVLRDVTVDTAIQTPKQAPPFAHGVELCECPSQYNSTSCQDPSIGFYRYRGKETVRSTIVIQLVGESRPCNCSGRSSVCDIETGNCINCSEDTGGNHCEKCAEGYYGNPDIEGCEPCPCPSTTRNFAVSCEVPQGRDPICQCRQGYTGRLCDRCTYGWYGFPQRAGGFCVPCECNLYGSVSDECHEETGQCNCRPGITARDCSQCEARHILTPRGCTSCDDGCTGLLLDKLDELKHLLGKKAGHLAGGLIAPPWEKLMEIEGNVTKYEQLWKLHQLIQQRLDQLPPDLESGLQKQAQQLLNKAKKMQKNCNQQNYLAFDTKTETDNLFSEIKEMQVENQGIILQLQSYGTTDGGNVNIASALHEARILIGEVRDNDYEPSANATLDVLRFCNETLLDLQERLDDHSEINDLKSRLDIFTDRINDFNRIISEASNETDKAKNITEQNKIILENVKKSVDMSNNLLADTELMANESTTLVNLADVLMGETQDNLDALHMFTNEIKNLSKSAEEKEGILSNLNPLYEEEYVRPAQKHADDLMKKALAYAGLFAETKQDADFPLRASKAYQDIVDALHGAREAAKNASIAADIAYEKAYPGVGTESLVDQATVAGLDSKRLLEDAQKQKSRVESLKEDLNASVASVSTLRTLLTQAALGDNAITRELQKLDSSQIGQDAEDILLDAMDLEENARLLQAEADAVSTDVKIKLRPQLQQLDLDGEDSLNAAQEMISETRVTVSKAQELVAQITSTSRRQNAQFEMWNSTVASKLEALRSKIMQARHIADGIRVSLTSHGEGGSCVRTYQPSHLEPSTMTSIVLTYAISSQERDALLFYLPSTTTDDFVAIEMVNRKMRFVWNVGGGPGEVTHSLHIQTAGDLSNDQHWYRVEAERISNVGRLSVRPQVLPDGSPLASGTPVTNASAAGSGRLDIGPGDRVWVGGADRRPPFLQSTQPGLVGCLHRLILDGRPIGLWDFRSQSTAGCAACIEGVEEVKDEQSYSFTGEGYTVLHCDSAAAYNKYLFSISLNFRTFDENALIFLAVGSQPERFVSLTLSQGHLVFRIGYGGDSSLEISTLNTYNTGNWTKLEASRYFDRKKKVEKGVLKVEGEVRDGAPTPPPSQDAIPDLSEAEYYVGGVPPGFKPDFPLPGSFLGCMSDIQVNQEGYNLLRGQFWGLQASCSDKPLTVVGFNGDGYLELSSHTLKKKGSFGFVFATSQHDALLMLSTFEGLAGQYEPFEDNEEITNLIEQEVRLSYYTVSLRRGQIDVRLNAGRGEVRLASTSSEYADEQFHSIAVSKTGRRLELRVDDTLHATATLPEGATVIKAPGLSGGLFFGGLPMGFNITGRTVSSVPFVGTIKDAIFNDQLLHFDWPISFSHAALGRVGPVKGSAAVIQAPSMATRAASGCRKVASYTIQSGAVKFGDSANTHVHINFRKRSILQKNYTLEMDFRTFYPNGLIFIVPGVRGKQHYIMASLRNGRLYVVLKGRKKIELTAQSVLNDGAWHHMILRKEERKMILLVDSIEPEKTRTPKKLNIGSIMYIGGLPESGLSLPDSLVSKIESFKGCMQGLKLNGHNEDLVGDKATPHRVGQCFPQVERGSYFPGDAYAIYKTRFNVGALLKLELEFRTSELNGILLSVSESVGYPALSLELHNGKVVMSGDMGDRRPFHVEQGFASEFAVCDNRWHRIEAHYIDAELTLRVDHLDKKYWLSDNGHLTEAHTSSPLYIGGIPDHAPSGTLQTRENFKGCIRNVVIGGERRDWTNMAALHNILLSSCPLLG